MIARTSLTLILATGIVAACSSAPESANVSQTSQVVTGVWKPAPSWSKPSTSTSAAAAAPRGGLDLVSTSQAKQETERRCSWEESDVQLGKDTKKTNPSCGNYKP